MKLGVPTEIAAGERRVALVPDALGTVRKLGLEPIVQAGAGAGAHFADADYEKHGATIIAERDRLFSDSDMLVKVQRPSVDEVALMRDGAVLVSFLQPASNPDIVKALSDHIVSAFSMDLIPRISRAQSMDVLSSQASI